MSERASNTPAPSADGYVLGVNEAELHRLGFQHRLWSEAAHACWERAGVRPGLTALDIGCGPGFASFDLAQIVGPEGRVIAVDEADRYLDFLRAQAASRGVRNIEVKRGDAQRLGEAGVPENGADFAYARWVYCFVPDPARAVREAARALRPGGTIAVHDYFNYECMTLAPRSEAFSRIIRAVGQSWRMRGGDPDIVGRLPALMADAGLRVVDLRPLQRLATPGSLMWEWPTTFFRNYTPELERMGLITDGERRAFEADWARASADPNTWMFLPPMFEVRAIKPE